MVPAPAFSVGAGRFTEGMATEREVAARGSPRGLRRARRGHRDRLVHRLPRPREISGEDAYGADLPKLAAITGTPNPGGWSAPVDPVDYYWVRVWAARVFLYVWRDDVVDALQVAAKDPAWRVREHVARMTAQRSWVNSSTLCCPTSKTSCPESARPPPARSVPQARPSTPKPSRSSSTTRSSRSARPPKKPWPAWRNAWIAFSTDIHVIQWPSRPQGPHIVNGNGRGMETSRRSVLKAGLASTAVGLAPTLTTPTTAAATPVRQDPFPHPSASPMAIPGRTASSSGPRLAVDPVADDGLGGMPSRAYPVQWQVATDERFHHVVKAGVAVARSGSTRTPSMSPSKASTRAVSTTTVSVPRASFWRIGQASTSPPTTHQPPPVL